jgi:hypothetical protein
VSLYRHALVWLLRLGGVSCFVLTFVQALTVAQLYGRYDNGEPGLTYLLDLMAPLAASLLIGSLIALTLAEILALQLKRSSTLKDAQ